MNQEIVQRVTPQQKLINVNRRLGNTGIKNQQGTTRILYDSLPCDGRSEFNFFGDNGNLGFPYTNLQGRQLGVGETLTVMRMYLMVVNITAAGGGAPAQITDFFDLNSAGLTAQYASGDLTLSIANQTVIKPISILSQNPQFNKKAWHQELYSFEFDTLVSIPPLVDFIFTYKGAGVLTPAAGTQHLRLVIEGVGSILNTRGTL